jgi:hypothetical protein
MAPGVQFCDHGHSQMRKIAIMGIKGLNTQLHIHIISLAELLYPLHNSSAREIMQGPTHKSTWLRNHSKTNMRQKETKRFVWEGVKWPFCFFFKLPFKKLFK